jgi:hypothetical protein
MSNMLARAGCVLALVLIGSSAQARIACNDDFQVVGGQEISTPYCRDGYLAKIAQKYGVKVTADTIRNNPTAKDEVCRLIGRDTRVSDNCNSEGSSQRGR